MGGLGALLVASLFFGWYRTCAGASCDSGPTVSAWEAFAVTDVALAVLGLTAVAGLVLTLAQRTPAVPLALTSIAAIVALAAAILALVALIAVPDVARGAESTARAGGAWLGTAVTLGLLAAMLASIRDERTPAPPRSVEEQQRAVRRLTLRGHDADARRDVPSAGPGEAS